MRITRNVPSGPKAVADAKAATTRRIVVADLKVAADVKATMIAKNADAGLKVAASAATTTNPRNADAGLRDAVSAVTTTIAKSADEVVDAGAVVKEMTTKSVAAGRKGAVTTTNAKNADADLRVAATTTSAKSAADPKAVADRMAVSVDAPKVTVAELAKNAKAGEDPKVEVVKTVNAERAVAARASIAKRS